MGLRGELVKLAHEKPELRRHLVPLLRKFAARQALDDPEMDKIVRRAVEDAADDLCSRWESDATLLPVVKGQRNSKFGSGSDGGWGAECWVPLEYTISTGYGFSNSKAESMRSGADDKIHDETAKWFAKRHPELGLAPNDISYHDLEEIDYSLAEEFDEAMRELYVDEGFGVRIGAFFYDPDSTSPWVKKRGMNNMYVFSAIDPDGRYLPNQMVTPFETTFVFKDLRDLKGKLDKALKAAVKAV